MTPEQKLQTFLDAEQTKLDKANSLTEELRALRFWNLRYWKLRTELRKTVASFELCDRNYNLNLPKL